MPKNRSHSHEHDKSPRREPDLQARREVQTVRVEDCWHCHGAGLDEYGLPCVTCFGDGKLFIPVGQAAQ